MRIARLLLILLFVGCSSTGARTYEKSDLELRARKLEHIINQFVRLTAGSPEEKIVGVMSSVVPRIKTGELRVAIDPSLPSAVLQGAEFNYRNRGERPTVAVSPEFVDSFEKNPSLVFSILMHEFTHAYSFFNDRSGYVHVRNNPLEHYFYELDSYHLEALFIRTHILTEKRFTPSKFETFLSSSFSGNNLAEFSYFMLAYDMRLAFHLNRIARSNRSETEKLAMIDDVIRKIESVDLDSLSDSRERFVAIVPLRTLLKFLPQTIHDIHYFAQNPEERGDASGFVLSYSYPAYHAKLLALNKLHADHSRYYAYHKKFVRSFGN